jgi:hypothetical protein
LAAKRPPNGGQTEEMMMRRPENRPTIRRFNTALSKLLAAGVNTYAENIRERGHWARLHKQKPKSRT